jgi:hypothetical protein
MKKTLLAASAALALFGAAPAQANVPTLTLTPVGANGSMTGAFEHTDVDGDDQGSFPAEFIFNLPVSGLLSGTITSTFSDPTIGDIDFDVVRLNNVDFRIVSTGRTEFRIFDPMFVEAGTYRLIIRGTSNGDASYAGTLAFAAQAVPEPATWALMILGFGGMGATLRRKRSTPALA